MTLAAKDILETVLGDKLPVHMATTGHLSVIHPFFVESGLIDPRTGAKVLGLPHGFYGRERSGGIYYFDEYLLYQAKILNNANVKLFGEINYHKSSAVKFMIYNGVIVGFNHLVIDPKGEYSPLVNQINLEYPGAAKLVKFGSESSTYINPLDNKVMVLKTQQDLIASLAITAMIEDRDSLDNVEKTLIWEAIKDAHNHYGKGSTGVATLPDVVDRLFNPTNNMAAGMRRPIEFLKDLGYRIALGLRRMTEGDLVGMFHKPTTMGLFEDTPLLVLDCSGVGGEAAVMMILLINFFTQSLWARENPVYRFHKVINDESWDLAAYSAYILSQQRAFKLGGTWGVANWIVSHRKSDLDRSGSHQAIKGLIDDSDTTICFNQNESEMDLNARALKLNEAEVSRIVQLPPGRAMHKVGNQPGIEVEHVVWPHLLKQQVVETRHLMHGITDLPRAA